MRRTPAVANQFYPGDRSSLTSILENLIPSLPEQDKVQALAVVSPHAGYVYSGAVAGETFARVRIPENVIILGPNHHGYGPTLALMADGIWDMPMGEVPINHELADLILKNSDLIQADDLAHRPEHSLEVQVPFLQFFQKNLSIVPLVVSRISYDDCLEVGRAIAAAIQAFHKPVLLVASTDMTHFESRNEATIKDAFALKQIEKLDPQGLYETVLDQRISMCGIMPTTIVLAAAIALGAKKSELVRYTDSGDTSGDTSQVVGYAGFVIS
ncbi:MAG: AmmeMemoRadiSam system protein B [Proteobacteria bacterium]|nr:AmmeMemoRadiSam system protein B [Pseudomonadota bacterium]MBU1714541.1 AmmeMemoRadiSam system protein B [Pseudomonadota bacterium]